MDAGLTSSLPKAPLSERGEALLLALTLHRGVVEELCSLSLPEPQRTLAKVLSSTIEERVVKAVIRALVALSALEKLEVLDPSPLLTRVRRRLERHITEADRWAGMEEVLV